MEDVGRMIDPAASGTASDRLKEREGLERGE